MKVAIIIAGGSGQRMNYEIPKQFINVYDKPIIIYTLEAFQAHPEIDKILVVCIKGWENFLWSYAKQFNISKLEWIIEGGSTGQESIRNGVFHLDGVCSKDDIVIIHDGIRPLIDTSVLSDVIVKTQKYGNAVTSLPYNEQIFIVENELYSEEYVPRDTIKRVSTPQGYRYDKIHWAYKKAFAENIGINGPTYANTLMVDLGEKIYFAAGSDKNIKVTTQDDLEFFKSYISRIK